MTMCVRPDDGQRGESSQWTSGQAPFFFYSFYFIRLKNPSSSISMDTEGNLKRSWGKFLASFLFDNAVHSPSFYRCFLLLCMGCLVVGTHHLSSSGGMSKYAREIDAWCEARIYPETMPFKHGNNNDKMNCTQRRSFDVYTTHRRWCNNAET